MGNSCINVFLCTFWFFLQRCHFLSTEGQLCTLSDGFLATIAATCQFFATEGHLHTSVMILWQGASIDVVFLPLRVISAPLLPHFWHVYNENANSLPLRVICTPSVMIFWQISRIFIIFKILVNFAKIALLYRCCKIQHNSFKNQTESF